MNETHNQLCFLCSGCAGPDGVGFTEAAAPSGYWPLFAMAFGVGNTNRMLAKWEKDGAYQKEALDERNIAIKEKAGNITGMLTTTLLGISLVVFVCMGYTVPALVVGGIILVQLVSLICVSSLLEKKM